MYEFTDTSDGSLVTATAPVVHQYGWTALTALVEKQKSQLVDTTTGAITFAETMELSLSHAPQVLLQTGD